MSEAIAVSSFQAFLEAEQSSEQRHELVGGRVYAMSGGSERHDLVAGFVYEALAPGARAQGCRPFISNRLVQTPSGNAYYPDVMVAFGPAPDRLHESSPSLYRRIESPAPVGGWIEKWQAYGPGQIIFTAYGHVDVDALYDLVDQTAATR